MISFDRLRTSALALVATCAINGAAMAQEPLEALKTGSPTLWALYQRMSAYESQMSQYVSQQGFQQPFEHLATLLHEYIHIDSLMHLGFFVDGIYYEPYVLDNSWPALTNKDVAQAYRSEEMDVIYSAYVLGAPDNTLGNVLDEINAYGHVIEFVCHFEPSTATKQVANLKGFLRLQEVYLREFRVKQPAQYASFRSSKRWATSRGALELITRRAWLALDSCNARLEAGARGEVTLLGVN